MTEATPDHPVRTEIVDSIGVLTMHRPDVRNAINPAMRRALWSSMEELEADPQVSVLILTGSDPAFCAGLDLKLLGDEPASLLRPAAEQGTSAQSSSRRPFPALAKPLIGAVNGAAITGGFELALNCDFLIASDRAAFADTHARVGVMPGWGLTPLLSDAVGRTRARQISLTGNFVSADQALRWGLVNEVVPHAHLMDRSLSLAADIAGNDTIGVRRMLATYADQERVALAQAWELEGAGAAAFAEQTTPGAEVAQRRAAIIARGRSQL